MHYISSRKVRGGASRPAGLSRAARRVGAALLGILLSLSGLSAAALSTTITNTASLTHTGLPGPLIATVTVSATIATTAQAELTVTLDPGVVKSGESATAALRVENTGANTFSNGAIILTPPPNTSLTLVDDPGGGYMVSAQPDGSWVVTFSNPFTPGDVISFPATVKSASGAPSGTAVLSASFVDGTTPIVQGDAPLTIQGVRTPSVIELLQYAPGVSGVDSVSVAIAECEANGSGVFTPMSAPTAVDGATIPVPGDIPLLPVSVYKRGEPIFVRVTDLDQNLDPALRETVLTTIAVAGLGDREVLRLTETGADTGVFIGYIQSSDALPVSGNCGLSVAHEQEITATYVDAVDGSDTAVSGALVDPFGIVFNSSTGDPVNGARVTLIDLANGAPATVFGDNLEPYPSTLTTGETVNTVADGGLVYSVADGEFRFPFVLPGRYRLDVVPPDGYAHPSTVSTATLQALPGAPFAIVVGSRGDEFEVLPGPALNIDIPVDPVIRDLFVSKTASKDVVGIGEFLQYNVQIQNPNVGVAVSNVTVADVLPLGFRYRKGSATIDEDRAADPAIDDDGRSLTFSLAPIAAGASVSIRYVVEVTSGARLGTAKNTARATGADGIGSNTAGATVIVREDLFRSRSFLMGRVIIGSCDDDVSNDLEGLKGVRIFLEDGTFVVTDEEGRWHIEGVRPGVHVVQLDTDSLPERYEAFPCEQNSRFAGRAYSRFVDLQGGTLWRADFHVQERPAPEAEVRINQRVERAGTRLRVELAVSHDETVELEKYMGVYRPPAGWRTVENSATVDGRAAAPLSTPLGLMWRLDPAKPHRINLELEGEGEGAKQDSVAHVRFASSGSPKGRTELARVSVGGLEDGEVREARASGVAAGRWADEAESEEGDDRTTDDLEQTEGILSLGEGDTLGHRINAVRVALKDNLKPVLLLDDVEVPSERIGFRFADEKTGATVYGFIGVDFGEPGQHNLTLKGMGPFGNARFEQSISVLRTGEPVDLRVVGAEGNTADGKTPVEVRVQLLDKDGNVIPAGAELKLLEGNLKPYRTEKEKKDLTQRGNTARVNRNGVMRFEPVNRSGLYSAVLGYNDRFERRVETYVKPESREWILVGLAHGTLAHKVVSGNMRSADESGIEDELYEDDRVAFYAKGQIKGEWLLTVAYDSENRATGQTDNALKQQIDPDSYYTLYGDAAEQRYDAPSSEKIYLRIERDQFYALFGDYDTGLTVTELSRYNRTVNGFKSEYQGKRFSYNAFATDSRLGFTREEIRGNGTSGLYRLERDNITVNTEKVVIETRDRFRSEVIITSEPLSRHVDYNIDYDRGTLIFKSPIPSKDANFNPIFIVVEYEFDGDGRKRISAGGRAAVKLLDDKAELGATYVSDRDALGKGELLGLDLSYEMTQHTRIHAEAARTDSKQSGEKDSGSAYLAEILHTSGKIENTLYIRNQTKGFGLGQQRASEEGTRKIGGTARYNISDTLSLNGEAFRQTNLDTDAERDVAETRLEYTKEMYSLFGGLRFARDMGLDGGDRASRLLLAGGSYKVFGGRVTLRLNTELSLNGKAGNDDYPNRVMLGADYRVNDRVTLFAEQEFTFGDANNTQGTRLGVRLNPWRGGEVSSSVEQQSTESGSRTFANLGLNQNWQINEHWSTDFGIDRSQTVREKNEERFNDNVPPASGTVNNDFTAVFAGVGYRAEDWSSTSRVEFRDADNEDQWNLFSGLLRELVKGIAVSASIDLTSTDGKDGAESTHGDLRLGYAYRPDGSKWIILDRLDYIIERQKNDGFDTESNRLVNNLNANYMWDRKTQLAVQYGAKYVLDTIDGKKYRGYTDLLGAELRRDIGKRWDVGARYSALHSWKSDNYRYSYGASVGVSPVKNTWVSVGYNLAGFRDEDFTGSEYTAKGPYIQFRLKADQDSVKNLLQGRWD